MRQYFGLRWLGLVASAGITIASTGGEVTHVTIENFQSQPIATLEASIEHNHPIASLILAQRLFTDGKKDEAVFWFYLGQLRYRAYLAVNPGLDAAGDPAVFASLMEGLGPPINEYAFGNIPALAAIIDRVIAWDANHSDDLTPHSKVRDEAAAGLKGMRDQILAQRDQIRKQRTQNGLSNRN